MDVVLYSTYLSVLMQVVSGIVQFDGLFIRLQQKDRILTDILSLETIVQFIEGLFYVWLVMNFSKISLKNVATKRYYDWVITTPLMLLATIMYMKYLQLKETGRLGQTQLRYLSFIKDNAVDVTKITISNALMLLFGYLGEIKKMPMVSSVAVGSLFFLYTFYVIYDKYAVHTETGKGLFLFLFVIWGLYAVAALMSPRNKNIGFNLLDVISKNFYGIYIYYVIKDIASKSI